MTHSKRFGLTQTACALVCAFSLAACSDKPAAPQVSAEKTSAPPPAQPQAKPQPVAAAAAPEAPMPNADEALAARVKKALENDPGRLGQGIDVSASGGKVRLWGTAPSASARKKAEKLALAMPGVTSVDNRIVVLKGS